MVTQIVAELERINNGSVKFGIIHWEKIQTPTQVD